jgi:2-polyprenyl-3-methyl-5-hydroxy-6-metoxy-1,4-benzoquinol methylase
VTCGFTQFWIEMNEPSQQQLRELQETLYSSSNPTRRWLHVARRDWIVDALRRSGTNGGRALEVGPGSGVYLPFLAELADEVVAADIEDAYLEQARELAKTVERLTVIRDDITASKLEQGAYRLVLCTEVIEHIADSESALAGLAKALADDGVLVLSTPQKFSPLELAARVAFLPGVIQLVKWVYREPVIPTGHINLLTEGQLRRQLEQAGLRVEEAFKTGFYLPLIAELGGESGKRVLQWCESRLRGSRLAWLLWTQCYIVRPEPARYE